jgi:hypothetical protein
MEKCGGQERGMAEEEGIRWIFMEGRRGRGVAGVDSFPGGGLGLAVPLFFRLFFSAFSVATGGRRLVGSRPSVGSLLPRWRDRITRERVMLPTIVE